MDSLWNSTEAIKDWEAMLSLLKAIPETSMVTLENQEETAVIEFMYSAAQKAAGTLHQVLGDKKKVGRADTCYSTNKCSYLTGDE